MAILKDGPTRPIIGGTKDKVKQWTRPVDRSTPIKLARNITNDVVSKRRFTEPAKKYAKEKNIRLIQGKK